MATAANGNQRATMTLKQTASYLKLKLGAAEVGPLLLPEVVRLDDEGDVDAGRKGLLQDLQQRLDAVPLRATHINDDREAMFTHLLAGMYGGQSEWEGWDGKRREGGECERGRSGEGLDGV